MSGYAKLFSDIVDSSIWEESPETCKVWVTLLALSDSGGFVRGSEGWLASKSRVSLAKVVLALNKFQESDLSSRTPDNDGRRIRVVERGWVILNYALFRDRLTAKDPHRTAYQREWMRNKRASSGYVDRNSKQVSTPVNPASASVSVSASKEANRDLEWLRLQLDKLFNRNGRAWTYAEESALVEVCSTGNARSEWNSILAYRDKIPPNDRSKLFSNSVERVLQNWSQLLDRAAVYEKPKTPQQLKELENLKAQWK